MLEHWDPSWWCYSGALSLRASLEEVGHWGGFWCYIAQLHFLSVLDFWTARAMRPVTLYTCSSFARYDGLCPNKSCTQTNLPPLSCPLSDIVITTMRKESIYLSLPHVPALDILEERALILDLGQADTILLAEFHIPWCYHMGTLKWVMARRLVS